MPNASRRTCHPPGTLPLHLFSGSGCFPSVLKRHHTTVLTVSTILHTHQRKIIHGDLKPANFVFVGTTLKLIDFGIARSVEADHTSIVCESQMGTLNYMSPESVTPQIKNSKHAPGSLKIGPATDVWALGCILFAMVYGVPPFQHVTMPLLKLQGT